MPGLLNSTESVNIEVPASDTRFMVLVPGGENPRPSIEPARLKVGIRVQHQSIAMPAIQSLRQRLIDYETPSLLHSRPQSTAKRSAFGARSFQAHIALIRAGSGIDRDLTLLGVPFRSIVGNLRFDKFLIETVCLTENEGGTTKVLPSEAHATNA